MKLPFTESTAHSQGTQRRPQRPETPFYLPGEEPAWLSAAKPPRRVTHLQRDQPLHVAWAERVNKNRCLG